VANASDKTEAQAAKEQVLLTTPSTGVALITLNRPQKLNAMTPQMSARLDSLITECNDSSDIRVVVLTGAGDRSFSVGSDITALSTFESTWDYRNRSSYCDAVRRLRKPSIAMVNGYAYGGGLEMALSCDIRVLSTTARLSSPEAKLGWIGGGGITALLAQNTAASNVAVLLMTGEAITAEDALRWGLASYVEPQNMLEKSVFDIAERIASCAPIATEMAKANIHAAYSMPLEEGMRYERDLQTIAMATDDAKEGRNAFAQKRPPRFTGR
jgi:enoyl-CoA hydratase/carnithine racemase